MLYVSIAFTLFHKGFFFLRSIQKMQTCKILPRVKSVTFSKGICLCNNFNHFKQHCNGTSCLQVNQNILQCARKLCSSANKILKRQSAKNVFKKQEKKKYQPQTNQIYFMEYNVFKTSNYIITSQKYVLKFNIVHLF